MLSALAKRARKGVQSGTNLLRIEIVGAFVASWLKGGLQKEILWSRPKIRYRKVDF
jgi:hypothetical protein